VQIACRDVDMIDALGDASAREIEWADPSGSERPHVPDLRSPELLGPLALLRRPFSLAGRRDLRDSAGGVVATDLDVIHRVVGVGTDWLSRLSTGDAVSILGPLGNRFELPRPDETAVLVGGGVGIPPMLYLAEALAGRKCVAFCGAVSRDLLPLTITRGAAGADDADDADDAAAAHEPSRDVREFARHGIPSVVTTDDGSYGFRGFVTQALERYLDARRADDPAAAFVLYTCGPEPMMKRVAEIGLSRGLPVQVAVERAMACGMGTCQSCCIKARVRSSEFGVQEDHGGLDDWVYKLACTDGPVFRADALLW
jgi:dihydroorotate dehydrogenase electron transfer subunit